MVENRNGLTAILRLRQTQRRRKWEKELSRTQLRPTHEWHFHAFERRTARPHPCLIAIKQPSPTGVICRSQTNFSPSLLISPKKRTWVKPKKTSWDFEFFGRFHSLSFRFIINLLAGSSTAHYLRQGTQPHIERKCVADKITNENPILPLWSHKLRRNRCRSLR